MGEHRCGVERLHDAGVALLSVLITPVGVVEVVAREVVDFLHRTALLATADGRAEGGERQAVGVAPTFFKHEGV